MRLYSCEIEQFGTLSHEKIEFSDGLNTMIRENGWGKTTFAAFIRAMFYGLDSGRKSDLQQADRRCYKPWGGGNYGGSIIFQVKGKKYRLERFFGTQMKEDTFCLYDEDTGLESSDYTENIGEELFGIDRDGYSLSIYVPQSMISFLPNDSLTAKLSSESGTNPEMDMNRYSQAMKRLKSAKQELMKTGKKGKIWELRNQIDELKEELTHQEDLSTILDQRRQEDHQGKLQIDALEQTISKSKEQIRLSAVSERRKAIQTQQLEKKEKLKALSYTLDEYGDFFREGVPPEETIRSYQGEYADYQQCLREQEIYKLSVEECKCLEQRLPDLIERNMYREKLNAIQKEIENYQQLQKKLTDQLRNNATVEPVSNQKLHQERKMGFLVTGGLFILLGAIAGALIHPALLALGGLLGVIFIYLFVSRQQKNQKEQEQKIKSMEDDLNQIQEKLTKEQQEVQQWLLPVIGPSNDPLNLQFQQVELKVEHQSELSEKKQKENRAIEQGLALREKLMTFLITFYPQPEAGIDFYLTDLRNRKHDYETGKNQYEQMKREYQQFALDHEEDLKAQIDPELPDLEELERSQEEADKQLESLKKTLQQNENRMGELSDQISDQQERRADMERSQDELEECEHKLFLVEETIRLLEEARTKYTQRYLGTIETGFSHYLNQITSRKLGEPVIDVGLNVSFREEGGTKELGYYSAGYRDLIGICSRLSLIDAIFEQEKPFLILDDPFVNLDQEKMKDAKKILAEIAQNYQTLYLSCQLSRA